MAIAHVAADDFLSINQPLTLHREYTPDVWQGKITDIEPAFLAIKLLPAAGVSAPQPAREEELHISIADAHAVYRFDSIYQSTPSLGSSIWYINKPVWLERQQQRRFVRIAAPLPARVRLPNSCGGLQNVQDTVTIDISGGGMCFVTNEPVAVSSRIGLSVANLPEIGELNLMADVVRCTPVNVLAGRIYHIGVSIEKTISGAIQNKLIRSIFCLQRQYIANGALLNA